MTELIDSPARARVELDQDDPGRAKRPAHAAPQIPGWLRRSGSASWMLIGIAIVVLAVVALITELGELTIPLLVAALLGATFLPVTDKLERLGVKRWAATLVVMVGLVAGALLLVIVIAYGLFREFPTLQHNASLALDSSVKWLQGHNVHISGDQVKAALKQAQPAIAKGVAGVLLQGIHGVAMLVFATFIGLNILVYFLADGRGLARWAAQHCGRVPQPVAYRIIANSSRFLRGYVWGSTIVGVFNGAVMLVGALIIGVPLAVTIGIVGWITNYIPTFGAIIGGAIAVLIALGAGGVTKALLMLIVVLIANSPLQTVVSQFALGTTLKLHPLAVLLATTAGAILFGGVGAIVAAPLLKVVLDASAQLKQAGLFEDAAPRPDSSAFL